MIIDPSLDIYYDATAGLFLLDNHVIDKRFGFRTSCGPLVRVPVDEMSKRGIEIVLENLKQFSSRSKTEKSELERMTNREQHEFDQNHTLVGVQSTSSNTLLLLPMRREPTGGHTGERHDGLVIPLPCHNVKFYKALLDAFGKTT